MNQTIQVLEKMKRKGFVDPDVGTNNTRGSQVTFSKHLFHKRGDEKEWLASIVTYTGIDQCHG